MRVYLATWTEQSQGETLTKYEIENRLLSFFFLKDCSEEWLENYFNYGVGLKNKNGDKK